MLLITIHDCQLRIELVAKQCIRKCRSRYSALQLYLLSIHLIKGIFVTILPIRYFAQYIVILDINWVLCYWKIAKTIGYLQSCTLWTTVLPSKIYPFSRQKFPSISVKTIEVGKITLEFGLYQRITVGNTVKLPKLVLSSKCLQLRKLSKNWNWNRILKVATIVDFLRQKRK